MLSTRAMSSVRRTLARFLVDTVRVYSVEHVKGLDETTLVSNASQRTLVWQGPARITPTSGPGEIAVGDSVVVTRDANIMFPMSAPLFEVDFVVEVVQSQDSSLDGRWFRITNVRTGTQTATRRVSVVQMQPSRQWSQEA